MSDKSAIEWTDTTWNPVRGCVKVSPGCAHCYAETFAERFRGVAGHPYEQGFDLRVVPEKLDEPLRWRTPRRVFVNSMSDLFQDGVSDEYIRRVFDVMAQARRHTFQVLTKRAERMRALLPTFAYRHTARDGSGWPLPNVWLGVSVESQRWTRRLVDLMHTPAAVRFVSVEPMLDRVNLEHVVYTDEDTRCVWNMLTGAHEVLDSMSVDCVTGVDDGNTKLDWVIVGGESGSGARPLWVPHVRALVQACQAAAVPVFVKQVGAHVRDRNDAGFTGDGDPSSWPDLDVDDIEADLDGSRDGYQGAPVRVHLRSRKGGTMAEWPEDLRVRQFPTVRA